jgi:hypothetical protein
LWDRRGESHAEAFHTGGSAFGQRSPPSARRRAGGRSGPLRERAAGSRRSRRGGCDLPPTVKAPGPAIAPAFSFSGPPMRSPVPGRHRPPGRRALLRAGRIEPRQIHKGEDRSGDGTVPRGSAQPPEWPDESHGWASLTSQTHALLQSTDSLLTQIYGMLTDNLGRPMGGTRLGLDIPEIVDSGKSLPVRVISRDGNSTLALHAICRDEGGKPQGNAKLLRGMVSIKRRSTLYRMGLTRSQFSPRRHSARSIRFPIGPLSGTLGR